ncbi:MAG: hypothetical protein J6C23_02480 [Clostridia bacterium]|nr:hypothetical protein [Clostridia bacterium]
MFFAIIQDKSPFITFTTAIKGTQKRIASVLCEKCELCLALDENVNGNKDTVCYDKLKNGDFSALASFSFSSTDTSVSVLLFTDNENEYSDYLAQNRIDDIVE